VEVLAPSRMPEALIEAFVQQKSPWIRKKLHFNRAIRAEYIPKRFQPGESFHLLGKPYALHLQQGKRAIELCGDELRVSHPAPTSSTTERQIKRWYHQQAEVHVKARSLVLGDLLGKQPALVGVKAYKSRWGSCHHDGRIYLNWRLIMAPEQIIDYVMLHELCHLIHANHSRDFWALVQSLAPDYNEAKNWLKINGLTLAL